MARERRYCDVPAALCYPSDVMLTPSLRRPSIGRAGVANAQPTWPVHVALGWALAGALNVLFSIWSARQRGAQRGFEWLSHSVDLGRHVGLGLASMAAVWLLRRYLPQPAFIGWLAFSLLSLGLAGMVLPVDLDGLAERSAESLQLPSWLALVAIVAVIGGSVPLLAWLTLHRKFGDSPLCRALGVLRPLVSALAALVAFGLNVSISPGSNPSAHLYLSWLTALCIAHALPRVELSGAWRSRALVAAFVLSGWSLWALFGPHSNSVMIQLARRPSSLHLLAVFHTDGGLDNVQAALASRAGPFFARREGLPDISPSRARPVIDRPIVILFSIDSLRADVPQHEEHGKLMPNLVELMAEGAQFSNARSPGSMTKYTLAAISSGKYFSQQYWAERGQSRWPSEDESVHLATLLSQSGVFTAAFPVTKWLENGTGVIEGFERNAWSGDTLPGRQAHWVDGASLTAQLIATLEEKARAPSFLWVHYLDSHDPFYKGGPGGPKFKRYLRALRVVDGYLGEVRSAIGRLGLAERTLLVVMSDHGEAFGEHDSSFHGGSLYDELVRVPLVVAGAGIRPRQVEASVSLIDLGPTLLDWFGISTPAAFMGESLLPLLVGEGRRFSRPIVAETRLKQAMLFDDGFKVVRDLRRETLELYNLQTDPGELVNLSDDVDLEQEEHVLLMRSFFHVHTYRENGYRVPYVK